MIGNEKNSKSDRIPAAGSAGAGDGAVAMAADPAPAPPAWVAESNRHAQILLEVLAKYSPEGASSFGVEGYDADVVDLKPDYSQRQHADLQAAQSSSNRCARR